jgi:hypothetical protein
MSSPAYIPSLSTWKNRKLREGRGSLVAIAKHSILARAAHIDSRKPACVIHCPGVNRPMRATACLERQRVAHLIPAIAQACAGCPRNKEEAN